MSFSDFIIHFRAELILIAITAITTSAIILLIIGKDKFKWLVWEFLKMYSGQPSFFSKKRVESGFAFWFAFWITAFYIKMRIDDMDIWAFGYILGVWLFIAGYVVKQIQSEKQLNGSSGADVVPNQKPDDTNKENG